MHYSTNSTDTTVHSERSTISKHESANWVWKVTLTISTAILSITVFIFGVIILSKYLLIDIQSLFNIEYHTEIEFLLALCLNKIFIDKSFCILRNQLKSSYVEYQSKIGNTDENIDKFTL